MFKDGVENKVFETNVSFTSVMIEIYVVFNVIMRPDILDILRNKEQ